jgi:hypothetical protein
MIVIKIGNYITKVIKKHIKNRGPRADPCGTSRQASKSDGVSKMLIIVMINKVTEKTFYIAIRQPMRKNLVKLIGCGTKAKYTAKFKINRINFWLRTD